MNNAPSSWLPPIAVIAVTTFSIGCATAAPLQTYSFQEPLSHQWTDELVHFDFNVPNGPGSLQLADAAGHVLATQLTDTAYVAKGNRSTGKIWTVVSLAPGGKLQLQLQRAKTKVAASATDLSIGKEGDDLVLANDHVAVRLPQYKSPAAPQSLTDVAAPVLAVRQTGADWLGAGRWFNDGALLQVKSAKTTIVESGPVRATVREELTLSDGGTYSAEIQLGSRQEAATISESTTENAPQAGWRFSMTPGLKANHVFWNNQWKTTDNAKSWALTDTAVKFDKENVVAQLRPWSFWWLGDISIWAGFYQKDSTSLIGVLATHPSRWSPHGWDGFDRTAIPITARENGDLDLSFGLLAGTVKDTPGTVAATPLHREWALTVGTTAEHLIDPATINPNGPQQTPLLRKQLIKYSEFPLDSVKDYDFDYKPAKAAMSHPFLVLNDADIARVRAQAKTNQFVKAQVAAATTYVTNTHAANTLEKQGAKAFYTQNYIGNYLVEKLPEAYIGSDDPVYGKLMAAAVQNISNEVRDTFLEAPTRPAIGSYGPWFTENFDRLLYNYDLIAGKGLLSPADDKQVLNTLVFGAHMLAHPDYWNPDIGIASANPNMTSSIRLPRGLMGLFLAGHPEADGWVKESEAELQDELKNWVSPGGAWIENPGYQSASLDGMFLLAAGLRNTGKHDYFADPQFKATMDYYGYLLTPPDRRFPPRPDKPDMNIPTQLIPGVPHPMTIPSFGDGFSGMVTVFNGWMANATAKSDPAYSARQEWFWKMQNYHFNGSGRAKGMTMAVTDADLPTAAPTELSRGFPGFGSVLRSSWTDPNAFYIAHRTGPNLHHYHQDFNSFVMYAKGAPLCIDFGNDYEPVWRHEAVYHSLVSFGAPGTDGTVGTGHLAKTASLPGTLEYSYGVSDGGGNQHDNRHMLMVESADPMGANYVVVRDHTVDGQPKQQFSYNLWCLSKEPKVDGNVVHFPGQFNVDLDVHLLSPANPIITTDHWNWSEQIYVWAQFEEEQYGIHVAKSGSDDDYLSLLYPRAAGQPAAVTTTLDNGAAVKVEHMEGTDIVLLSPGTATTATDGDTSLHGEIAFARHYTDNRMRLAAVQGDCNVTMGGYTLSSSGPTSIEITPNDIHGISSGDFHVAAIALPAGYGAVQVTIDGKDATAPKRGAPVLVPLPDGYHSFTIARIP